MEGPPPPAGSKVAFPPLALDVPQVAPEGLLGTGHACRATSAESLCLRSASPRCAALEARPGLCDPTRLCPPAAGELDLLLGGVTSGSAH